MEITPTTSATLKPAPELIKKSGTATPVADPKAAEQQASEAPSALKSFTYGALGLDHPEEQAKPQDESYTAGKWLSAAAKVGAVISLLA